ncbi:helix-turn-helix domain-containing protein [Actinomyces procaprae]|uniref:helix-turn-helix domain-containing protein n=1 Tax=Actinomyces procaprae TaxID=2560010 RepID=UPI0014477162|nr:helix-turn-helix transcriptional regulator [Actinomyces procaprae]
MVTNPSPGRVAEVIAADMKSAEMSVLALARATQIPRVTLQRRLRVDAKLELQELAAIASALGTTVSDLISRAETAGQATLGTESTPAVEAHGVAAVERVGAALAGVPAEALLQHEQVCDSCWSLDDAARHLSGDEDPATHRSSDEEVA